MLTLALSPESEDIALPTHRRVHEPEASLTFSVWRSHWRARHRHDHLTGHTLEPGLQHSPLPEAAGCGGEGPWVTRSVLLGNSPTLKRSRTPKTLLPPGNSKAF